MSAVFVLRPQDFDLRLCQAHACPNEADGFWGLCVRHAREQDAGQRIQIHTNPPPGTPTLWCAACKTDKPDHDFEQLDNTRLKGRPSQRRGRFWCCTTCVTKGKHR